VKATFGKVSWEGSPRKKPSLKLSLNQTTELGSQLGVGVGDGLGAGLGCGLFVLKSSRLVLDLGSNHLDLVVATTSCCNDN
jgi:hypothetical protein